MFLALFASFRARSHWIVPPFMLVTLYALLSSTGSHLGLSLINYCLPLLNKFREPDRHLFVFVFGISVLAALGFGYLVEVLSSSYRKLLDLKHLAVVVTTFGLLIFSVRSGLPYIGLASKTAFLLGSGFALLPLVLLPFIKGRGHQAVAAVVVFLIIFAGFLYPKNVLRLPDGDYFSAQNLASHRVLEELARLEDVSHYRIMFADEERREQKWAMNATYYDLRTFYLYCNIVPYQQFEEMYLSQINASPYSLLLGAKYYALHPLYPLKKTLADINIDSMNVWGKARDVEDTSFGMSTLDDLLEFATRREVPTPRRGVFILSSSSG